MAAPYFHDFWGASDLDSQSGRLFAESIQTYQPTTSLRVLSAPSIDRVLSAPSDALSQLAAQRKSQRTWSPVPVTELQFGALLSVFAARDGSRSFPSAGSLYPLEIVCATANVDGYERALWMYNSDNHSVSKICALPIWQEWQSVLASGVEREPALSVFFCLMLEDIIDKYGERAGRFALLEAGHAGQMFALRAAYESIATYAVGGVLDQSFLQLCEFNLLPKPPLLALTYVCGVPETTNEKKRVTRPKRADRWLEKLQQLQQRRISRDSR
jgi:SagB-type dehydrogenase family enzyme